MDNICQKTNFDLIGGGEPKDIYISGKLESGLIYKTIEFEGDVFKLGYCTNDNKGMNYPIFLIFSNDLTNDIPFYIGKTGMFEIQPEQWYDDEVKVFIKKIKIYEKVPFVVDYCYSI